MERSLVLTSGRGRRLALAGLTVAALLGAAGVSPQPAAAAPALPPTTGASQPVIVMLKDQLGSRPADKAHVDARRSAAHGDQAAVLRRLSGAKPTKVVNYTVGNAFAATVTAAQAAELAADPAVASVVPDRTVTVTPPTSGAAAAAGTAPKTRQLRSAAATADAVDPKACSADPAKPVLEPEALQTMNVRSDDPSAKTAAALGIDGSGVKVAFIADGLDPANEGFKRTDGSSSVVDYQDFYGDGPNAPGSGAEAFGDASAISAQGNAVYDVADFSNPAVVSYPGGHCYIRIVGVAPGSDVVALKAGAELLPNSAILQSIDYAVTVAKVDVINESFGANVYPDSSTRNTIQTFNDNAVKAGVTVTASTGDAGVTSTIGSPATDPLVISTGASTDSRIYEQTGYALATKFGNGSWLDSNISSLSSAGITQAGRTIDLSAPGEADWAVCSDSGNWSGCASFGNPDHPSVNIQSFGGTSQSAPLTAGAAALVIQAYRKTHDGVSPTPARVKRILTSTARDLGMPGDQQGTGLLDARAAVEAALTWPGADASAASAVRSTAAVGTAAASPVTDLAPNIALSKDQLSLTGRTGGTVTGRFSVRNVGQKAQSVVVSTRRSALLAQASQTVAIKAGADPTTPYPTTAAPWSYKTFTFDVGTGADQLDETIRWASGAKYNGAGPVVRLSLFAPDGTYAGNTRPQGGAVPANYGLVQVKQPVAGTWTGVLYTNAKTGFSGDVTATNQTFRSIPVGKVRTSRQRLQPGQSASVTLKLPVPTVGGDTVYTASVGSSGGHQTAVPVVVRALVPVKKTGAFAGTISGGNGRAYSPAETFSYAFDVPAGKKDLRVGVTLAKHDDYLLEGVLVDPQDEVQSISSNQSLTVQGRSMQSTVAAPAAGRWRYVVVVVGPVPGKELTETFNGTVAFDQVRTSATALPRTLARNVAVTSTVTITNTGPAEMVVQTDARLDRRTQVQLAPQFAGSTLKLPQDVEDLSQLPAYLVPPDTTKVSLTASSTTPAQVELNSPGSGIDLLGDLKQAQNGDTVSTATVTDRPVGLGYWFTYVQQIGPFSDAGAPAGTSVLTGTAVTKAFDPAVTSSTGDPFLSAVDPTADAGTPVKIGPGATKTLTVTITPTGAPGRKVSGVLHLVSTPYGVADTFNTTGEVLANIPYAYTVR